MTISVPRSAIIEELRNTWQWDYHQTILLQAADEIERLERLEAALREIMDRPWTSLPIREIARAALEGK